jgi:hypothetical protein
MVFGKKPFNEADKNDKLYSCVAANRFDCFWDFHCKKMVVSEELKDLIMCML